MNERVSRTLDQLQEFNILHQSGKNQSESTKKNYINQKANVVDFIDDVSEAISLFTSSFVFPQNEQVSICFGIMF